MFEIQVHDNFIDNNVQQTISGREMHASLEIGRDYTNWIKDQINRLQLVENIDYIVFALDGENLQGGRPRTEYYFTIDIAKHIALASHTAKGREYRQALIDLEKQVHAIAAQPMPQPITYRPEERVMYLVSDWLKIAELCGAPAHIGLEEARKSAAKMGIDILPALKASPAMMIEEGDRYMEPTELGKYLGIGSGIAMNRRLASLGLQNKINGTWIPTDKGEKVSTWHSWSKKNGTKSGSNLKWNVAEIERLVNRD